MNLKSSRIFKYLKMTFARFSGQVLGATILKTTTRLRFRHLWSKNLVCKVRLVIFLFSRRFVSLGFNVGDVFRVSGVDAEVSKSFGVVDRFFQISSKFLPNANFDQIFLFSDSKFSSIKKMA